jgi:hypothetical protein
MQSRKERERKQNGNTRRKDEGKERQEEYKD